MPHHPPTLIAGGRWQNQPTQLGPSWSSPSLWSPWSHQYPQVGALPAPGVSSSPSLETLVTQLWSPGMTLVPSHRPPPLLVRGRSAQIIPHFLIWLFFSDSVPMYRTRPIGEDLHFLSSLDFQCMISIDQQSLVSRPVVLTSARPIMDASVY